MNNTCDEMRLAIEASIGRPLAPNEREDLKRHLAECPSCRAYREALLEDDALLDEYVSCHADSLLRTEDGAARARPAGTGGAPSRALGRGLSRIPRIVRIAAAAAAAAAIIVAVDFFRGAYFGPIPAFASVIENARKAESVTFRLSTWLNGEWRTEKRSYNRSGAYRIDYGDSIHVDASNNAGSLSLYPIEKRAIVWGPSRIAPPAPTDENSVMERIATWHKKHSFNLVRRERYKGKNVAIFESTFKSEFENSKAAQYPHMRAIHDALGMKYVVWVDRNTTLPVRIEIVNSSPRYTADSSICGLRLRDFMPPGTRQGKASGWVEFRDGEPRIIWDDFAWNASVDTSLFSLTPPADYSVRRNPNTAATAMDWKSFVQTLPPGQITDIRDGLAEWLPLFGDTFPDSLSDMADAERVRPRLIARYNGDGVPGDEYRKAIHAASQLQRGVNPSHRAPNDPNLITYVGRGCAFGDSTKAICWMRTSQKDGWYWILYADLHLARSDAPPKR
jgi:hypothetical protein